ncbi:MAG: SDR family oxidoreductase [Thermoleophilaceae bacterium]
MKLEGRLALVTGASSGIGAAAARALAERGATVVLVGRRGDKLREVAGAIGPAAHVHPADVGDMDAVAGLGAAVESELGLPDVVVNNAGAGRFLFVDETTPAELVSQTSVPYLAAFFVTRAFVEGMIARGSGHVVCVNTPISRVVWPGAIGYAGARWALRGFTEALRADLRGTGVGVTEVVPGKVSSDYFAANPGAEDRIPSMERLMRGRTPAQCAAAIVRGIEREHGVVYTPPELRALAAAARLFPRPLTWLAARTGARRPA